VEVEPTDAVRPGVVSIPHGWGDGNGEVRMHVAAGQPATNSNVLAPAGLIEPLSGNAVLNGIPVQVAPA
jgi:anaerobic selenocysteine-containing dehydrogenase